MRKTTWAVLLTVMLLQWAWAQPERLLLLPVILRGDLRPAEATDFQQQLLARLAGQRANLEVVDSNLPALDFQQKPSPDQIKALAQQFGAHKVAWIGLRWRSQMSPDGEGENDPVTVRLSLAADLSIYDAQTGQLQLSEPLASSFASKVKSNDLNVLNQSRIPLARQCLDDMVGCTSLVFNSKMLQAQVEGWRPALTRETLPGKSLQPGGLELPLPFPGASSNLAQIHKVVTDYLQALRREDPLSAVQHQQQALLLWRRLKPAERKFLEGPFPGIAQWITKV